MVTINYTLEQAIQFIRQDAAGDIQAARKRRKQQQSTARKLAKLTAKLAKVLPEGCTLDVYSAWSFMRPSVEVQREALPALRKAVGALHVQGKDVQDAEKGLIKVALYADKYPGISFWYIRPVGKHSRCKIITQTTTYHTMACDL